MIEPVSVYLTSDAHGTIHEVIELREFLGFSPESRGRAKLFGPSCYQLSDGTPVEKTATRDVFATACGMALSAFEVAAPTHSA